MKISQKKRYEAGLLEEIETLYHHVRNMGHREKPDYAKLRIPQSGATSKEGFAGLDLF